MAAGRRKEAAEKRWRDLDVEGRIDLWELERTGTVVAETRVPGWPEWIVSGLFALHDERLLLVELRVFPAEDRDPPGWLDRYGRAKSPAQRRKVASMNPRLVAGRSKPRAGEWSRDPARLGELAVGDGLPAQMLKDIRTGPLFDLVQGYAAVTAASAPAAPEVYEQMAQSPNPGRHRRADLHWAEWARRLHEMTASGPRPIGRLADDLDLDRAQVRDIAHECRRRGFLTAPVRGRGGGYMTEKARKVLADAKRRKRGRR